MSNSQTSIDWFCYLLPVRQHDTEIENLWERNVLYHSSFIDILHHAGFKILLVHIIHTVLGLNDMPVLQVKWSSHKTVFSIWIFALILMCKTKKLQNYGLCHTFQVSEASQEEVITLRVPLTNLRMYISTYTYIYT